MPHVVLVRDPRYPIGGFETWVETLAAKLPERGINVTLLAPRTDGEVLEELTQRAARGEHGVFFTGGYPYLYVAGINLLGSPWVPVPVLHGRDPGAIEWLAVGPPPRIVAPSAELAESVRTELAGRVGRLRTRGRIVVIPHGVEVPDVVRPAPSLPLQVIVVSRFEEDLKRASDYVRIVEAAAHLPLQFTFIGDGSALPEMRAALGDRARFTGALPRQKVYEELLRSDVLLSASSSEAFGLAIAEALACGCAVVAADAGGSVRELLGGKVVPVGDVAAFVRQLEELVKHPRRDDAGRERIRTRYSADAMADAYASLVRRLRSRPNAKWHSPMYRTPAEALPRTLRARVANWLRAFS